MFSHAIYNFLAVIGSYHIYVVICPSLSLFLQLIIHFIRF